MFGVAVWDGYDIVTTPADQRGKKVAGTVSRWVCVWGGTKFGAAIGSRFGPWAAVGGGLAMGTVSGIAGQDLGEKIYELDEAQRKQMLLLRQERDTRDPKDLDRREYYRSIYRYWKDEEAQ